MKTGLIFWGLVYGTSVMADANLDCVKKVTAFYGLKENTSKELLGMNNGKKCELKVEYLKFVSGLNQKESNIMRFYLNVESSDGDLMKGIWTNISSNEDTQTYSISKCEIKDNQLELKYRTKEKFGWRNINKITLSFTDKSISMTDKESGFWVTGSKEAYSCQF